MPLMKAKKEDLPRRDLFCGLAGSGIAGSGLADFEFTSYGFERAGQEVCISSGPVITKPQCTSYLPEPVAKDQGIPVTKREQLVSICQFIEENLLDPDLSPEMIARHLGLSRATLYRVAAPIEGVQRFVRNQRLHYAMNFITSNGSATGSISNLAFDLGFGSENTFRRAFRELFGVTPTQARQKGYSGADGLPRRKPWAAANALPEHGLLCPNWMHTVFAADVSHGENSVI